MERLKVKELRALSKSLGLKGYSKLHKSDLVKLVMDHLNSRPKPVPKPRPPKPPIQQRPPIPPRPPPRPQMDFKPYQLKDTNKSKPPPRDIVFDPKKLKRMKKDSAELNRKIRNMTI